MSMKYAPCERCGTTTWLNEHHILPKSIFHGQGETILLCPNCHTDYHKQIGNKSLKSVSQGMTRSHPLTSDFCPVCNHCSVILID